MMGRKSLIGIAVLCAVAVSAFAAANAATAQRAVTCTKSAASKTFSDAHCLTGGSTYGHVAIADNTTTTVTGTNEKTSNGTTAASVWKLRGQLAGVITEIECTGLHGHGALINRTAPANHIEGEGTATFTGCTVKSPPGCTLGGGGTVTTEILRATTESRAAGTLLFRPATGFTVVEFSISGCPHNAPPAGTYAVTGEFIGQVSGATLTVTHAQTTAQEEVEFGGISAGIEGVATINMAEGSTPNVTAGEAIALT